MLSEDKNRLLTRVGPGTPMGNLMRRYWQPVGAVAELDDKPIKAVRLMGEDLVLYRDLSGTYGLTDRQCAHRRADLSYGFVEQHGIRCNYHGWCFNEKGRCIEQPFEETVKPGGLKDDVRIKAYPVEARGGLLWAYLGPEPAPICPNWEPFTWKNGFVQIVFSEIPCNWFQCQENSIDPVHFEWMHSNWSIRLGGAPGPYSPKHTKLGFDEFDYGFIYRRVRTDTSEQDPLWTVGRVCLWPNCLFTGDHFEWRVPIDDERTLSVGWFYNRVPKEREPFEQNRIPYWYGPIKGPDGRWISSHVMNQDFIAWVGQGTIADRTGEYLGASDRGVAMIRRRFFQDLETVANGGDPKAVVRDEKLKDVIQLPVLARKLLTEGLTRAELEKHPLYGKGLKGFVFQAGQPNEVRRAFNDAMGSPPDTPQGIPETLAPGGK